MAGEAIHDLAPALSRLNALPLAVDGTEVAAIKHVLDIYEAAVTKAQREEDKKTGNSAPKVSISLDPVALVKEVDLALAQVCPLCSHSSAIYWLQQWRRWRWQLQQRRFLHRGPRRLQRRWRQQQRH